MSATFSPAARNPRTGIAVALVGALGVAPLLATPAAAHGVETGGLGRQFFFANAFDGVTTRSADFGRPTDRVYAGDWDGDGVDTLAVRRGNVLHLQGVPGGPAVRSLAYGKPGDEVVVGDWDGNGTDTFGVRRGNQFLLANGFGGGVADIVAWYGRPDDVAVVGDWDGNGTDTPGVRRGNQFLVTNSFTGGAADVSVAYGRADDVPFTGDWNGDRRDTPAVRRGGFDIATLGTDPAAGCGPDTAAARSALPAALRPWCPSGPYYGPVASVPAQPVPGVLGRGNTGVKVAVLRRALGMRSDWAEYDTATVSAVQAWQGRRGLPATGRLDRAQWALLGTGVPWDAEAWQVQPNVGPYATRSQRIEAMIAYARSTIGAPYVWGAAGPTARGFDCSGLVIQATQAAGLDIASVNPVLHAQPGVLSTALLYNDATIQHVPFAQRKRGDLIFWSNSSGGNHVAIYLGNDRVLESTPPATREASINAVPGRVRWAQVLRPFADDRE